ncbi:alpha/beta fold hydrolase [Halorientalis marina]|jgi:hypothetical protein|uniref:alpha/beta fold hydrolase n=1 Tax=Halorientalis marina TaxID=2931976 RepID=UPI001FF0E899|nr:alpha/beta fold hydrolase [Halorientalis marina]
MEFAAYGEGEDLLLLLGWGNRLDGDNVRWFVDRLVDAGYRVHAAQLPTNGTDFEADYLDPVQEYRNGNALQLAPVVGHSTGGLVGPYLQPDGAVYCSPWWEFYGLKLRGMGFDLVRKLSTDRPLVPIDFERSELGALVSDSEWASLPKRVSPGFVAAIHDAQERMPDPGDDARVFCSLRDTVVGLDGIGAAVDPEQVTLYDGGHELFASADRDAITDDLLDALDAVA